LILVRLSFVHRNENTGRLNKLFYIDAPPPVFPKSLRPTDLISGRLYMTTRNLSCSNGLTYVTAEYAGGVYSRRNNVVRSVVRESEQTFSFTSQPRTVTLQNPNEPFNTVISSNLTDFFSYSWVPLVHSYEYVEIGSMPSYEPTAPPASELYSLTAFSSSIWRNAPELGWGQLKTISYERGWFEDKLSSSAVKEDRKPNFVTPTVKTIQHRFYLDG
jgi:hypothetical protein